MEGSKSTGSPGDTWNSRVKSILVTIIGNVPPIGGVPIGKMVSFLLGKLWPDLGPDIWSLIKEQVEGLIDEKILHHELQERNNEIRAIQKTMQGYVDAQIREKGSLMSTLIHACNELCIKLTQSKNSVQLIPLVVTHSTQHLLILKERLQHGKEMYDEDNTPVWRKDLEDQISSYKDFIKDIYPKWVEWRKSQIIVDVGTTLVPVSTAVITFTRIPYGEVFDQIGKDRVRYTDSTYVGYKRDYLKPICEAVKKKMFGFRNGEMLQILVPTFYLDNFIPGNEDNPSVIPSSMSIASFGPISPHLDGKERKSVLYTPGDDNTREGNVTSINVIERIHIDHDEKYERIGDMETVTIYHKERSFIEGLQLFYSTDTDRSFTSGGKVHRFPLNNRKVKSMHICYDNCNVLSVTIWFSNGECTGRLGNRGKSQVKCVKTGGIDTYGLYNIRAADNTHVSGKDCDRGLFQIELDYKAYPVRPSELINLQHFCIHGLL